MPPFVRSSNAIHSWNWETNSASSFSQSALSANLVAPPPSADAPVDITESIATDVPALSFAQWADLAGGDEVAAPSAAPDDDGSANLLGFAFGSDPRDLSSSVRPTVVLTPANIEVTATVMKTNVGLTYAAEISPDAETWTAAPGNPAVVFASPTAQILMWPLPRSLSRQFIRMRVTAE